ncbi:MAG: hypothetical protein GY721_11700 [Deltaproteobacteria bacterium]|nr:hypothetical protein [Deltaproteobacteria bacterium]
MNIEDKHTLHSVIGGMTTDYFDFFCQECGSHINEVDFYGFDSIGIRLMTQCSGCGDTSIFKIKSSLELGPIQSTFKYGKYDFKAYDKRKFKKYKRKIEEKLSKKYYENS